MSRRHVPKRQAPTRTPIRSDLVLDKLLEPRRGFAKAKPRARLPGIATDGGPGERLDKLRNRANGLNES